VVVEENVARPSKRGGQDSRWPVSSKSLVPCGDHSLRGKSLDRLGLLDWAMEPDTKTDPWTVTLSNSIKCNESGSGDRKSQNCPGEHLSEERGGEEVGIPEGNLAIEHHGKLDQGVRAFRDDHMVDLR